MDSRQVVNRLAAQNQFLMDLGCQLPRNRREIQTPTPMQVTETAAEGLRREFKIVVPADTIEEQVDTRLKDVGRQVKIPGFRPGKVPLSLLRKRFASSLMGEVLEGLVNETSSQTLSERGLRPALSPKIEITQFDDGSDLEYTMAVELLPEIEQPDYGSIELERMTAEVDDATIDQRLERIAESQQQFKEPEAPRPAADGDRVSIDFHGAVDGEERPELHAHDFPLVLGSGSFFDGFEDALIGADKGDTVAVSSALPESFHAEDLAGKTAEFKVEVKSIEEPQEVSIDEDLAKNLGFEDLDALRAAVREHVEKDFGSLTRMRLKRALLDRLADLFSFESPQGLIESEFENIWKQVEQNRERLATRREAGEDVNDPDLDKPEEELRSDYQKLAERRVRLGLALAEIGHQNNITVSKDEMNQAMIAEASRYPSQQREYYEFLRGNPEVAERLRAPIYEDKVVDFILELVTVTDRTVPADELLRDPDENEEGTAGSASEPSESTRSAKGISEDSSSENSSQQAPSEAEDGDAPPAQPDDR